MRSPSASREDELGPLGGAGDACLRPDPDPPTPPPPPPPPSPPLAGGGQGPGGAIKPRFIFEDGHQILSPFSLPFLGVWGAKERSEAFRERDPLRQDQRGPRAIGRVADRAHYRPLSGRWVQGGRACGVELSAGHIQSSLAG
ncbi:uncharacterized protein LOC144578871 [Callithrix jacchus]